MKYYLKLPVFHMFKNKSKHLSLYKIKLIKTGTETVFKNNNPTLYDYSLINQLLIIKSLKPSIYKENIIFAHYFQYFDRSI